MDSNPNAEAYNRAQMYIAKKNAFQLSFYADILLKASETIVDPPPVLNGAIQAYKSARDGSDQTTAEDLFKDFATLIIMAEQAIKLQDDSSGRDLIDMCQNLQTKWTL